MLQERARVEPPRFNVEKINLAKIELEKVGLEGFRAACVRRPLLGIVVVKVIGLSMILPVFFLFR